jgi:hypothetical protein
MVGKKNRLNTTKGGEVKMKNKIILAVLCVVLLLLLTSLSYGWWGNLKPQPLEPQADSPVKHQKARLLGDLPLRDSNEPDPGDPWDHMTSPPVPENSTVKAEVNVIVAPFNFNVPIVFKIK